MTTVNIHRVSEDRSGSGAGTFRLGDWVLVPSSAHPFGKHSDAYIERAGQRVRLRHCSSALEDFTEVMSRIEADFARRCLSRQGSHA